MGQPQRQVLRWLLLVCIAALLACEDVPRHEVFSVGMTRAAIVAQHGEPRQISQATKHDEPIWGAIESFWSQVPLGSSIETWSYATTSNREPGTTELYFVDGSDVVSGLAFAPEGVVYEGQ